MNNYPDRFIFNEEKDQEGNTYKKAYSNHQTNCVLTFKGTNTVFSGRPCIFTRKGASKFGKELGFYFKIDKKTDTYPTNTPHDVVEFYMPEEKAIEFLEQALAHFKANKEKKPFSTGTLFEE